eukprot:gene32511-17217_t
MQALYVEQAAKMKHKLDSSLMESSLKVNRLEQCLNMEEGSRQRAEQQVEELLAAVAATQQEAAEQLEELQAAVAATQREAAEQVKELQAELEASKHEATEQVQKLQAAAVTTQQEAAEQLEELQAELESTLQGRVEKEEVIVGLSVTLAARQMEAAQQVELLQTVKADLAKTTAKLDASCQAVKAWEARGHEQKKRNETLENQLRLAELAQQFTTSKATSEELRLSLQREAVARSVADATVCEHENNINILTEKVVELEEEALRQEELAALQRGESERQVSSLTTAIGLAQTEQAELQLKSQLSQKDDELAMAKCSLGKKLEEAEKKLKTQEQRYRIQR